MNSCERATEKERAINRKKPLFRLLSISLVLVLSSCATLVVDKPGGFAEVQSIGYAASQAAYKAVSPEGLLYRVRTEANYPPQSLDFWAEALKNHLVKEGYTIVGDGESFQAGELPGVIFEWVMPYGQESYIYLTAIIVSEEKIAIAEAAAEHSIYHEHRDALRESLLSIRFL